MSVNSVFTDIYAAKKSLITGILLYFHNDSANIFQIPAICVYFFLTKEYKMTSIAASLKQIPINAGYFVCISGGTNVLYDETDAGDVASSATKTVVLGEQYLDLGVTKRPTAGAVYRRVIKVGDDKLQSNVSYIKLGDSTINFARMG